MEKNRARLCVDEGGRLHQNEQPKAQGRRRKRERKKKGREGRRQGRNERGKPAHLTECKKRAH